MGHSYGRVVYVFGCCVVLQAALTNCLRKQQTTPEANEWTTIDDLLEIEREAVKDGAILATPEMVHVSTQVSPQEGAKDGPGGAKASPGVAPGVAKHSDRIMSPGVCSEDQSTDYYVKLPNGENKQFSTGPHIGPISPADLNAINMNHVCMRRRSTGRYTYHVEGTFDNDVFGPGAFSKDFIVDPNEKPCLVGPVVVSYVEERPAVCFPKEVALVQRLTNYIEDGSGGSSLFTPDAKIVLIFTEGRRTDQVEKSGEAELAPILQLFRQHSSRQGVKLKVDVGDRIFTPPAFSVTTKLRGDGVVKADILAEGKMTDDCSKIAELCLGITCTD